MVEECTADEYLIIEQTGFRSNFEKFTFRGERALETRPPLSPVDASKVRITLDRIDAIVGNIGGDSWHPFVDAANKDRGIKNIRLRLITIT